MQLIGVEYAASGLRAKQNRCEALPLLGGVRGGFSAYWKFFHKNLKHFLTLPVNICTFKEHFENKRYYICTQSKL
jgi:hypothetical protein